MSFSKAQAGVDLAAIADVVRRVKQSRIYRVSGDIAIVWGLTQFVQFGAFMLLPSARHRWSWVAVDGLGVAVTILMLRRAIPAGDSARSLWRALGAFALFYGFGFLWSDIVGQFDARGTAVFWRTLFLFGYCLAGLEFGAGFLAIGLGLTAAILAVYLYAGAAFWPLIALVGGFGYILCGLWMRRA